MIYSQVLLPNKIEEGERREAGVGAPPEAEEDDQGQEGPFEDHLRHQPHVPNTLFRLGLHLLDEYTFTVICCATMFSVTLLRKQQKMYSIIVVLF